jgi:hypothetical protein
MPNKPIEPVDTILLNIIQSKMKPYDTDWMVHYLKVFVTLCHSSFPQVYYRIIEIMQLTDNPYPQSGVAFKETGNETKTPDSKRVPEKGK